MTHKKISKRDPRIDYLRGLAIVMIFIDHIANDPVSRVTFRSFGFSDAAEIFVLLSGVVCGTVYSSILQRKGAIGLAASAISRCVRIYVYYLIIALASTLAIGLLIGVANNPIMMDPTLEDIKKLSAEPVQSILLYILLFIRQPGYSNILVLYLVLTAVAVPVYAIVLQRSRWLTLCIAISLWLIAPTFGASQFYRTIFPAFNPAAWQLLFLIGFIYGYPKEAPVQTIPDRNKWIVFAAVGVLVLSLIYKIAFYFSAKLGIDHGVWWYDLRDWNKKYDLSVVRIAHILCVMVVIEKIVPKNSRWLFWGHEVILKVGRNSLQLFALSAVLSVVWSWAFVEYDLAGC